MNRFVVLSLATFALAPPLSVSAQLQARQVRQAPAGASSAAPPQPQWTILSESFAEGSFFSTSWSSDVPYDMVFEFTDLYVASDAYEIYDQGVLIHATAPVLDWDGLGAADPYASPPFEYDPNAAFSSGLFSSGTLVLGPGPHTLTIRDVHIPPTSAGGPPFADGSVAFRAHTECAGASAVPAVSRDTVPPHAAQIVPFSQNRAVIGAAPGLSVAPPDVRFLPPNPASTSLIFWAIATAPADIPAGSLGTFLVSVTYPDPLILIVGSYPASDVLAASFVPNACVLIGVPIFTQGCVFETNGAIQLTNALDYVLGLL